MKTHIFRHKGTVAIIKQIASKSTKQKYPEFVLWTNRNQFTPKTLEWSKRILAKIPKCVVHGEAGTMIMTKGLVLSESDILS